MSDKLTPEQEFKIKHSDWQRHIDRVRNVMLKHAQTCVTEAETIAARAQPHNKEQADATVTTAKAQLEKVESDLQTLLGQEPSLDNKDQVNS